MIDTSESLASFGRRGRRVSGATALASVSGRLLAIAIGTSAITVEMLVMGEMMMVVVVLLLLVVALLVLGSLGRVGSGDGAYGILAIELADVPF